MPSQAGRRLARPSSPVSAPLRVRLGGASIAVRMLGVLTVVEQEPLTVEPLLQFPVLSVLEVGSGVLTSAPTSSRLTTSPADSQTLGWGEVSGVPIFFSHLNWTRSSQG